MVLKKICRFDQLDAFARQFIGNTADQCVGVSPRKIPEHFQHPNVGQRSGKDLDMLYLSGQLGTKPDGTLPQGIEAQARQTMDNIGAALKSAGIA